MHFDVLVIGSGIAGCMAAFQATEEGANVALASLGPLFSGSSFYGGTWGLGLIAPKDQSDQVDLANTIMQIGGNAARRSVVDAFVEGIKPAVSALENMGVELRRPSKAEQREYIACFDHKHRDWYGIEREPFKKAVSQKIKERGIATLPRHELLDILQDERGVVCGAILFDHASNAFIEVRCKALVLACGGASTLFSKNLSPADCLATSQALALQCGAQLENFEFLQFMPATVSPKSHIVFNEKAFRFCTVEGNPEASMLDQRSTYGPFTCRLDSKDIDFLIDKAGQQGLSVTLNADQELPEFVTTYYEWLHDAFGLKKDAPVKIAHFAHASNGGILVNENAETTVAGLFAAGEATGGMHGADRLGGLSSANCLVFGLKAGKSAARWAQASIPQKSQPSNDWQNHASAIHKEAERSLRHIMDSACSIKRTEAQLSQALSQLHNWEGRLASEATLCNNPAECAATRRTALRLQSAQQLCAAALARTESLGSHYRAD